MKIFASLNTNETERILKQIQNKHPYYEAVGQLVVSSVMKNFETGGRPKKWQPLAMATILVGAGYHGQLFKQKGGLTKGFERHLSGKKILVNRGRLRDAVRAEAHPDKAVIGANLVYARIHQLGGFAGRGKKVFIPARPYIVLQDEDRKMIISKLHEWVMKK